MRWELWLPLGGMLLIAAALIVLLGMRGVGTIDKWAQVSTILLVSVALIVGMVVLVVLVGLLVGVSQVLRILPSYARLAQNAIENIERQIIAGANISAQPVIEIKSFLAMVNAFFGKNERKS